MIVLGILIYFAIGAIVADVACTRTPSPTREITMINASLIILLWPLALLLRIIYRIVRTI